MSLSGGYFHQLFCKQFPDTFESMWRFSQKGVKDERPNFSLWSLIITVKSCLVDTSLLQTPQTDSSVSLLQTEIL